MSDTTASLRDSIACYRRITACSPTTPWCNDPTCMSPDHYDGHREARHDILERIFALASKAEEEIEKWKRLCYSEESQAETEAASLRTGLMREREKGNLLAKRLTTLQVTLAALRAQVTMAHQCLVNREFSDMGPERSAVKAQSILKTALAASGTPEREQTDGKS